jgi:hypothetical protein
MEYEDYENMDDLSITKVDNYQQFLDKFITNEDKMYLEDEDLIRDVKHFHAVNKGNKYITAR